MIFMNLTKAVIWSVFYHLFSFFVPQDDDGDSALHYAAFG